MFFMRLRRGAKWVFVLLVFAFAFGFLFSGVGGGGGGDIIEQLLGMRGGNATNSAEQNVKKHPNDPSAWTRLAVLYQGDQKTTEAINAYNHFLKLKPNDAGGLAQLAQLWQDVAAQHWNDYTTAATEVENALGPFNLGTNTAYNLYADPLARWVGQDPLLTPYLNAVSTTANDAYLAYRKASNSWEKAAKRYVSVIPATSSFEKASVELTLAQAATNAGDKTTAIKAYKAFIKLQPKDSRVPQVKKAIAELQKTNSKG